MTADPSSARLADSDYLARTAAVLSAVEGTVDRWLEDDVIDIDAHRTGGLLELAFPDGSKIIVNTQPPLQELWLAARSGGMHFKCSGGQWTDTRSNEEFFAALSRCASEQAGKTLHFAPAR